jgi:6-phosphogluconate dehydrogenase
VLLQQDDFQGAPASIALLARRVHGIDSQRKVDDFLEGRAKGKTIIGCYSIEEMVANLAKPARVQLMVKAGEVVDQFIEQVLPHLSAGDIIIDGGNRCRRAAAVYALPVD